MAAAVDHAPAVHRQWCRACSVEERDRTASTGRVDHSGLESASASSRRDAGRRPRTAEASSAHQPLAGAWPRSTVDSRRFSLGILLRAGSPGGEVGLGAEDSSSVGSCPCPSLRGCPCRSAQGHQDHSGRSWVTVVLTRIVGRRPPAGRSVPAAGSWRRARGGPSRRCGRTPGSPTPNRPRRSARRSRAGPSRG